jgi:hypothetical protein
MKVAALLTILILFAAALVAIPAPPDEEALAACHQVKSDDGTCFNWCVISRNGEVQGYVSWYGC